MVVVVVVVVENKRTRPSNDSCGTKSSSLMPFAETCLSLFDQYDPMNPRHHPFIQHKAR